MHDMLENCTSKKDPSVDLNDTWNDLSTRPISNLSPPTVEDQGLRSPSPNIILRSENEFLSSQSSAWDPASDEEEEAGIHRVPDVRRDDLASRRAHRGPVAPNVHQFVPSPVCSNKDRERWEGIRRSSQKTLQEKEIRSARGDSPVFVMFFPSNNHNHTCYFFGCCDHHHLMRASHP